MVILSSAAQAALPRQLSKAVALTQVDRAAPEKESPQGRTLEEIHGSDTSRPAAARV
jgi:hypothetical protein